MALFWRQRIVFKMVPFYHQKKEVHRMKPLGTSNPLATRQEIDDLVRLTARFSQTSILDLLDKIEATARHFAQLPDGSPARADLRTELEVMIRSLFWKRAHISHPEGGLKATMVPSTDEDNYATRFENVSVQGRGLHPQVEEITARMTGIKKDNPTAFVHFPPEMLRGWIQEAQDAVTVMLTTT